MPANLAPHPLGHLAAIVQYSDDAIVSKLLDSTITSWNCAAEKLFGYSAAEAVGKSIRIIVPEDRWHEEDEVLAKIRCGEVVDHYETVRQRRDGTLVEIALTVSPIKDENGDIVGASKIARDISSRKRAEVEQLRAEAERVRLFEAAQAANRVKDEFLAVLSHELRTPLNAILGWSDLLALRRDAATLDRGIAAISRNVKVQAKLIDDLLNISQIAAGKIRLDVRPIELAPIVADAIDAIAPAAEAKQIQINRVFDPADFVLGDPERLQQVVWNLLSNAVKFTPRGGRIQLTIARVNSQVELAVSDNGQGIEPDYLPFVFDRFSQADSSPRRKFGGLGLGLNIARELVQLHGGSIEARSAGVGSGATFVVKLPCSLVHPGSLAAAREHPAADASAAWTLAPDLTGARVLVVDDSQATREVAQAILQAHGAEVILAASAAEALGQLASQRPQVLLADIEMPDEDGYSLLRRIRALPDSTLAAIPAAAVTACARPADRWQALAAGFQLHLAKPAAPQELALAVLHLIGLGKAAPGSGGDARGARG
jgi:PAS domain S-box-containing protein